MKTQEVREKFLKFFEERGHAVIPSSSLVPENDPSVLFITAGMHPLVPFLMGESHPAGKRLTDVQKSLRTGDIDEVGDAQHLTFFEMLGYWSLGDYFKKESIRFTFDFYTQVLGIHKDQISVTVFEGDKDAPFDEESYETWKTDIGIPEERIYRYSKKENWWGPVSETGPCGPCTEMFIDTGKNTCSDDCGPACDCGKFVEIGNNVFMEYFKNKDGIYEKLSQKNVDVGLGLERLAMFVQGKSTVFEIDIFKPIIEVIRGLARLENENSLRIVADHIRAATFALADEVLPSNIDRGYVVRRLIRRAIRHGRLLGIEGEFTSKLAKIVVDVMGATYNELRENEQKIYSELDKEEKKFNLTLQKGQDYLVKELERLRFKTSKEKQILVGEGGYVLEELGELAFNMFQNYGYPLEMTQEALEDHFSMNHYGLQVDPILLRTEFDKHFKKHQELSKLGAEKKFKGGLGEQSEIATRYHTATHLLNAALRNVLGPHVFQRGSNITAERMRFDFSHPDKMTPEEIKAVEDFVNDKIQKELPVIKTITTVEEAKTYGAIGIFNEKYGEKVSVYSIGGQLESKEAISKEICGGPHVKNTGELGHFRIKKEESSSAGVRRIKGLLE